MRAVLVVLFVLCAMACGLAAGTFVGGRLVPEGSGLAGPMIALGYGVIGAVIALVVAVLAAWRIQGRAFLVLALAVIGFGLGIAVLITLGVLRAGEERDQYLASQRAALPPFDLDMTLLEDDAAVGSLRYTGADRTWQASAADGKRCQGTLAIDGEDKLHMLVALRQVEGVLVHDNPECDGTGTALARLSFSIVEATGPATRGELVATRQCLGARPTLDKALRDLEDVYRRLLDDCS